MSTRVAESFSPDPVPLDLLGFRWDDALVGGAAGGFMKYEV
ncbi:MAG: hypothetical protein OEW27_11335 [Aquincola sp.]|nr:hypothetical protein [Aquincola sp.]